MSIPVQFYQLRSTPLERALPKLVEKAYGAGYRIHLVLGTEERAQYLNDLLWTYDPGSFLPHGTAHDAHPELQPVFISAGLDAPNMPTLLFITDGSIPAKLDIYHRLLDVFDGNDPEAIVRARVRWKHYKALECDTSYFRQTENGGWEAVSAAA